MKTKQQRKYKLHYNLRKRGNKVVTRERWVVRRAQEVSKIEAKWLRELADAGYCVSDDMFSD